MISIVTPNYNGERWLPGCLDSVARQTSGQDVVEMIIEDDGSTDGSKTIIESYNDKIPHMSVSWNEHIGLPGVMRNEALARASGSYALFLDSDDYLGDDAIRQLWSFAEHTQSDVIMFQLNGLNRDVPKSMLQRTVEHADIIKTGLYKSLGTWKMCRTDFLSSHNLKFSESKGRGEDVLFFAEALLRASSVSVVSGYPFYTIRGREDGSSITQQEWDPSARLDVARRVGELAVEYARSLEVRDHFLIRIFNTDALAIINSKPDDEVKARLRDELTPYWTEGVAKLIYTDNARDELVRFFGSPIK